MSINSNGGTSDRSQWEPDEDGAVDYEPDDEPALGQGVEGVRNVHEASLLARPGVVGVGVGQTETGDEAVMIYLEHEADAAGLPETLDGAPVVWEVTGPIEIQDDG